MAASKKVKSQDKQSTDRKTRVSETVNASNPHKRSTPLKKAFKSKLKDIAAGLLDVIDDDDQRAIVNLALTEVVKKTLSDYDDLQLPDVADFKTSPNTGLDAGTADENAEDNSDILKQQIKEAKEDVEEAEADLLRFRKNRKEIERRERDEEQHKLHPFVQRLYPEMGKAAAINEDVSEAEWLQSLLILKAEELEKEDEVEIGVSVEEDEWFTNYLEALLPQLTQLHKATEKLSTLDNLVEIAANATKVDPT